MHKNLLRQNYFAVFFNSLYFVKIKVSSMTFFADPLDQEIHFFFLKTSG